MHRSRQFLLCATLAAALPLTAVPAASAGTTADLSVTKEASPGPIELGDEVTFTITVTNDGPDSADAVTLTDVLDADLGLVSVEASVGACLGLVSISCDLGSIASGDSATVTIVATADALGPIENTAVGASTTADIDSDDLTSAVSIDVLEPCTIEGTAGRDRLRGTSGDDVICGRAGKDRLIGRGGNDQLRGGGGADRLRGGGTGADRLRGAGGKDRLLGIRGRDRLLGGPAGDTLAAAATS